MSETVKKTVYIRHKIEKNLVYLADRRRERVYKRRRQKLDPIYGRKGAKKSSCSV